MKLPHLLLALLLPGLPALRADEPPARLDLTGRVITDAGEPVPGATILILSAGPRHGTTPICPSSYEDCGKRAATDAQGVFRIASLDPTLSFNIAALAPGYDPGAGSNLLPEAGVATVKLHPRDLSRVPSGRHIAGRILDPEGHPVPAAILTVEGLVQGDTTRWSGNNATESQVITDRDGEFHLAGHRDFDAVFVTVDAPGLAGRWARLEPGKTSLLRLKPGSAVHGRLLFGGRPLAGIALGASSRERECGKYFDSAPALTDAEGRFVFPHLPPGTIFRVYAHMASLQGRGTGFLQEITTPAEGVTIDLGDLSAQPAYRLAGQVVLSDGHPIPPQTRLMLDRTDTGDIAQAMLDGEGRFDFDAVPSETVCLYVTVPGYRLSSQNPGLERNTQSSIIGRVAGDLEHLRILLEPGARPAWGDLEHPTYEETQQARRRPLQSAP